MEGHNISRGCQFSCNWNNVSPEILIKACAITEVDAGNADLDIDSITSLESCVCLARDDSPDPPEITITAEGSITRADFVSEAKIIEIFRGGGEYLTTCHSEFVDDWEDMAVHYTKILVPVPEKSLTFRFSRMKYLDRIWIYGVRIQITPGLSEATAPIPNIPVPISIPNLPPQMLALTKKFEEMMAQKTESNATETTSHASNNQNCKNCQNLEEIVNKKMDKMEENILEQMKKQHEEMMGFLKTALNGNQQK